jgi:hypothetical protein
VGALLIFELCQELIEILNMTDAAGRIPLLQYHSTPASTAYSTTTTNITTTTAQPRYLFALLQAIDTASMAEYYAAWLLISEVASRSVSAVSITLYYLVYPILQLFRALALLLRPIWGLLRFVLLPLTYAANAIITLALLPFRLRLLAHLEVKQTIFPDDKFKINKLWGIMLNADRQTDNIHISWHCRPDWMSHRCHIVPFLQLPIFHAWYRCRC